MKPDLRHVAEPDLLIDDNGLNVSTNPFDNTITTIDNVSGNITVSNFPVTRQNFITIVFRCASASDDNFISKCINDDTSSVSGDWRLLNHMCVQWGDEDKSTIGYFMSKDMPYQSLVYLRTKVLPYYFPRFQ